MCLIQLFFYFKFVQSIIGHLISSLLVLFRVILIYFLVRLILPSYYLFHFFPFRVSILKWIIFLLLFPILQLMPHYFLLSHLFTHPFLLTHFQDSLLLLSCSWLYWVLPFSSLLSKMLNSLNLIPYFHLFFILLFHLLFLFKIDPICWIFLQGFYQDYFF